MFELIFFFIGTFVLAFAITMAIINRHDTKKCTAALSLGILFTTFFYILPTVEIKECSNAVTNTLYQALNALLFGLKTLSGRQTVSDIYNSGLTEAFRYIYIYICYIMFFTAPIISTALLVSFFGDMGEKIRYALHFSDKCYVFSELNCNSISIARGIKKHDKHAAVVFCNTKSADTKLVALSKRLGGICLYKSCSDFHVGSFHKIYEFYVVCENEDENISFTAKLIEKNKKCKAGKIIINSFAQSGTGIDIIESIEQSSIILRFIDQAALLCNQIIFEHPLYNIPNQSKDISVMILGCGRTGMQMLKTVAWCGQIDGYSLKIRVYDNKAKKTEKEFIANAPELDLKKYNIDFIEADINSDDFEQKISESADATYVFIATGDDELNLHAAAKLRGIFRRREGAFDLYPKILTRVRDNFKNSNIKKSPYLEKRNIDVFGNVSEFFENNLPFETKFEKLALAVHLAYSDKLGADKDSEDYKKACNKFYAQEYNRRSSMATALHIASKLRCCNVIEACECELTSAHADSFEKLIAKEPEWIDKLARNEHERWNAFFRSEGYRTTDIETIKKYCKYNSDSHKDMLSKLHPCLTDWDELDPLADKFNSLIDSLPQNPEKANNKDSDNHVNFKEYDIKIIKYIPAIIRYANETDK